MTSRPWLGWRLEGELRAWARLRPRLWWRDDDARAPTPELDRLLAIRDGRPIALAVVPNGESLSALAERLTSEASVTVGQHGVDHVERSRTNGQRSEHAEGVATPLAALVERIGAGRTRLKAAGLRPAFYTPPWNAGETHLPSALNACGYTRWSAGPIPPSASALAYLASDVDVLRWKGGAAFKGRGRCLSLLAGAFAERRRDRRFDDPTGLLTHHLAHDAKTWRFLAWLLPALNGRVDWVEVGGRVVEAPRTPPTG